MIDFDGLPLALHILEMIEKEIGGISRSLFLFLIFFLGGHIYTHIATLERMLFLNGWL